MANKTSMRAKFASLVRWGWTRCGAAGDAIHPTSVPQDSAFTRARTAIFLAGLSLSLLLSGCATFRVPGLVESGRQALVARSPERALAYFQEAVHSDPEYIYRPVYFRTTAWTYLGRSQYQLGQFNEARRSFEKALPVDPEDHMARLYLGLTLARIREPSQALKHLSAGLRGLHEWLDYMEAFRRFDVIWDPQREIRSAIQQTLAIIEGKDIDRETLIANGEWIGERIERGIDYVRRDEWRRDRESDRMPRRPI